MAELRRMESLGLTAQLEAEWRRAGLSFRVMLVGESGLGKSTFTRALFRPYVPDAELSAGDADSREPLRARTAHIREVVFTVENEGFPVEFTVVDCPGYGDSVDSTSWIDGVVAHVVGTFEKHFEQAAEAGQAVGNGLQRDGLVHACLYFVAAHRLKGVDIEFMRRLQPYVNLIPVIAKADTMTVAERDAFRRLILAELRNAGVRIFELDAPRASRAASKRNGTSSPPLPAAPGDFGEAVPPGGTPARTGAGAPGLGPPPSAPPPQRSAWGNTSPPPFAVCASEDGTRVYPWGTCCVEDAAHSDLPLLRSMLFAGSMLAAKRGTLALYEEAYARGRNAAERRRRVNEQRALRMQHRIARALLLAAAATAAAAALSAAQPRAAAHVASAIHAAGSAVCRVVRKAGQGVLGVLRRRLGAR